MRAHRSAAQARREALIGAVAAILDAGEPTRFRYESAAVAGLRSGMCLQAWRWPDADAAARVVVDEALRRIGAERPRWIDGQPEFVEPVGELRMFCIRCGAPLPEDIPIKARGVRKYCSTLCKQNQVAESRRREETHRTAAERAAAEAAKMAERAKRRCAECGGPIKSREKEAKFCGRACAGKAIRRVKKGRPMPRD